jgi:hypothetical protein
MNHEKRFRPAVTVQEANWKELEKLGIVALRTHHFSLEEYVKWLAVGAAKENDNWAKHPFTGHPLPWSVTTLVRMNIASLFEAHRDDRELSFDAVVVVFKDVHSKQNFDAKALSGPFF